MQNESKHRNTKKVSPEPGSTDVDSTKKNDSKSPQSDKGVDHGKVDQVPPVSLAPGVEFPNEVSYFDVLSDISGEKSDGILRLKKGAMVAIYKAEDKDWWLGKAGDEIGWIPAKDLSPISDQSRKKRNDAAASAVTVSKRLPHAPRDWETDKFITSEDAVTQLSDFDFLQYRVYDSYGNKVAVFFIQVTGGRKNESWVVAKTVKAFNRLRVAWEEDFGANMVPVEPPPVRFPDCTPENWELFRIASIKSFLAEVKLNKILKESHDFKHFLVTDKINSAGGVIKSKLMKPFLDKWVRTSCEPAWTAQIPELPPPPEVPVEPQPATSEVTKSKNTRLHFPRPFPLTNGKDMEKGMLKFTVPGLKPVDELFGKLISRRPRMRRSETFAQISALAAVTRQEACLEIRNKGWSDEDGMKLRLLDQGGAASALRRRNVKRVYTRFYDDESGEASALLQRGSMSQIKFTTRFHLEKVMYGRMESINRDIDLKYAMSYTKKKRNDAEKNSASGSQSTRSPPRSPGRRSFQHGSQHGRRGGTHSPIRPAFGGTPGNHSHHRPHRGTPGNHSHHHPHGGTPGHVSHHHPYGGTPGSHGHRIHGTTPGSHGPHHYGISPGSHGHHYHHNMKNRMFGLDAMSARLEHLSSSSRSTGGAIIPSGKESTLEKCQYMSHVPGETTKPLPAQLAALEELPQEKLEHWVKISWPAMGAANLYHRLREIESFLEKRRVRCSQVVQLLGQARAPEEKVMIAIICCARLTDAVEAKEMGLWTALHPELDDLNMERARLCCHALSAEAHAEEASRGCRRAAREVYSDVQRARKALAFISSATPKVRNGVIKADKFSQLKDRLGAAADVAHEEYRDAVRDAKPASDFAAEAMHWMEVAEKNYLCLEELGSRVYDRVGVVRSDDDDSESPPHDMALQQKKHELAMVQEGIEISIQIVRNAYDLASRAADNARQDMHSALEEVVKAEKVIKSVELEERRARNECECVEGHPPDEDLPEGCPFATWSVEMRKNMEKNLVSFVADGQYRTHIRHRTFKGPEDSLLMVVLLAKVQLVRDIKNLRDAKAEEEKKADHAKNVQASRVAVKVEKDKEKELAGTPKSVASHIREPSGDGSVANESLRSSIVTDPNKNSDDEHSSSISSSISSCSESSHEADPTLLDNRASVAKRYPLASKKKKKKKKNSTTTERMGVLRQHDALRTKLIKDTLGTSAKPIARKNIGNQMAAALKTPLHGSSSRTFGSPTKLPVQGSKMPAEIWHSDGSEKEKSKMTKSETHDEGNEK